MPIGARGSVSGLLRSVLCTAVLIGATAAQAGPLDLSAPLLDPCPLFPGAGDPAYCRVALPPVEEVAVAVPAPLQLPPSAVVATMPSLRWQDIDPYAIVFPVGALPELPPLSNLGGFGQAGDGLGFTVSRSDAAGSLLSAAYDVPVREGLQLQSHSALSEAPDTTNSIDAQTYDANSGLSVTYAAMPGVTLAVEPAVAVNWGDAAGSQTRVGVGNRLTTHVAQDLSVMLSAGYDSFFFAEDPLQNYRALHQRIAMTWGRQGNWQFGLSAASNSQWDIYEERRVISPGVFVTMPLGRDVSLTTRNDFGVTHTRSYDDSTAAREDYRNTVGLQAVWQPTLLSAHALRVMADYSLSYDTALAADSSLTDGVSLYETLVRVAVAMRF